MKSATTGEAFVPPEAFHDDARRYVAAGRANQGRLGALPTLCAAAFIYRPRLSAFRHKDATRTGLRARATRANCTIRSWRSILS